MSDIVECVRCGDRYPCTEVHHVDWQGAHCWFCATEENYAKDEETREYL